MSRFSSIEVCLAHYSEYKDLEARFDELGENIWKNIQELSQEFCSKYRENLFCYDNEVDNTSNINRDRYYTAHWAFHSLYINNNAFLIQVSDDLGDGNNDYKVYHVPLIWSTLDEDNLKIAIRDYFQSQIDMRERELKEKERLKVERKATYKDRRAKALKTRIDNLKKEIEEKNKELENIK